MRISSSILLPALLMLWGCGEAKPDNDAIARVEADQRADADADGRIVCAVPGSTDFARQCRIERTSSDEGTILTMRQPDGGFHRLLMTKDGRGVISADGSEAAKVTVLTDSEIEVAIGGARYRLPAKIGPIAK